MKWVWLLLVLTGCRASIPSTVRPEPVEGRTIDFTVKRFPEGTMYSLSQDKGHVVLLDVWATWCEVCKDVLPVYEKLAKKYEAQGLRVYALSVDEDKQMVSSFIQHQGLSLPVLIDDSGKVAEGILGVRLVPTSLLFDKNGTIRFTSEGVSAEVEQKLEKALEHLFSEDAHSGKP